MGAVTAEAEVLATGPYPIRRRSVAKPRRLEPGFLLLFAVFVAYLVLPLLGMALFSLGDDWVETVLPRRCTLEYWATAISHPLFLPTFTRSLVASAGTVILSLVLMTPTLFVIHVAAPRLRPFIEFVSLAPFALPTVVFALSLIRTYSVPPLVLTGTPLLLILSYTVLVLPFVYRSIDNSLRSLDTRTLYEAAQTLGASRWEPFRSIILPNIRRGLMAASLLVLSVTFGEYTLSAFLVGDAWKTSGVWIYTLWNAQPHETMAVGVLSFAITWGASLAILAVLGRQTAAEVGRA
jgi:putative spermidine/putrescine transport system permease protein